MANLHQVIDETGNRHGRLTVIKRGPDKLNTDGKNSACWWCECDCGLKCVLALGKLLRSGRRASCGCLYRTIALRRQTRGATGYKNVPRARKLGQAPNEVGNTYDMLTVVKIAPEKVFPSGGRHAQWYCKCACGKKQLVLRTGNWLRKTKAFRCCGCQRNAHYKESYFTTHPMEQIIERHRQRLSFFGKAELVGEYRGDSAKTEYRCLIHDEVHPAFPTNMGRGWGLLCCKKSIGWDGLAAILDGTFRAPTQSCWVYLFHMENYPGHVKVGIASCMDTRPDEEYGELIRSWKFDNRIDAALVEEALKQATLHAAAWPKKLRRWVGRTEVRKLDAKALVKQTAALVKAICTLGRWPFVLKHISMSAAHRDHVLSVTPIAGHS